MKALLLGLGVLASIANITAAEPISFSKSRVLFERDGKQQEMDVDLVFTDRDTVVVKNRKGAAVITEILYASINKMTYEFAKRRRLEEGAIIMFASIGVGAVVMATKSKSHWLTMEYRRDDAPQSVVLRSHKDEYRNVLSALESRTGRTAEILKDTGGKANPTVGSKNTNETLPYPKGRVLWALKSAMQSHHCEVTQEKEGYVECKRPFGQKGASGIGGEKVTAELKEQGDGTRVSIETGKGFRGRVRKKNWSTPIFQRMKKILEESGGRAPSAVGALP